MNLLAADVGGTKTLLMLVRHERGHLEYAHPQRFDSTAFADFESMADRFLANAGIRPGHVQGACLAIAGPVSHHGARHQSAQLTNLPWHLDTERLSAHLDIPVVSLINDFEGVARSLDGLPESAFVTLQPGNYDPAGPRLLVGAGTGLGVCAMCPAHDTLLPGEGGHSGFAPADAQQVRLWQFVAREEGRCSREHLLSGRGITRIAAFLQTEGHTPGPALAAAMTREDPAAALSRFALLGDDPLAWHTLRLFVRIYGSQTGDLALGVLPAGGVYLAGGIAPRILPLMQSGDFVAAFVNKPPMGHLLTRYPVRVIIEPHAGLFGAARWAYRLAAVARQTGSKVARTPSPPVS